MGREDRGSPFEILGAWLGVWTPRHGVVIPPPPSRRTLAVLGLALAGVVAIVAIVVAPALRDVRERNAAAEAATAADRLAARNARLRQEQRARRGRIDSRGRAGVLATIERRIGADARARFDPDARTAACRPAPGAETAARRVAFDCHAAVRDIVGAGEQEGARGTLSIPYRAVVDFATGRYAFCKTNPPPGERAIPRPGSVVPLSAACRRPDR